MSSQPFGTRARSTMGAAYSAAAVTPDDAAALPGGVTRALYVGAVGSVRIEDAEGGVVTLVSGPAQYHPIMVRKVFATGTTAADILALY